MKKLLLSIALVIGIISCGGSGGAADKKEEKKDQKLVFYAGLQEDHAAMIAQEFEKETGIKTEFVRLSSGETLARLKAEKDNMTASVWGYVN